MKKRIKLFGLEVKDLNDRTGEVTFQFGAWSKDLDGEIIEGESAYKKTIAETMPHIYHNRDHKDAVVKPKNIFFDKDGAYCTSQLALKTINGLDCYEQYKSGLIKGHSQEFQTIKEEYSGIYKARVIKELKLWGVTSVTEIPANLDTPTLSLKAYEEAAKKMEGINKLLHEGNASDELCENFCVEYKKLSDFVRGKTEIMKHLGIVHCASCDNVVDTTKCEPDTMYMKCPGCGKFVNKVSGALKPSLITPGMISGFTLP